VPGVVDQTRGILTYVEANCLSPKALGIEWICLAGTYKTGVKEFSRERFSDFIVGQGYKQVCGAADASGDGITPVESAQLQLEGVENIVLDGVFHTPVGSNNEERPWYGTKKILDLYYHYSYNERVRESVHVVLARVRLRSSLLNVFYSYHFFVCFFIII
jgi:hypothetical protein